MTDTMVGGNNYTRMKYQWVRYAMHLGLDVCASNILKYVCRHGTKGGYEGGKLDIEKAMHYVALRQELMPILPPAHRLRTRDIYDIWRSAAGVPLLPMSRFCEINGLRAEETNVLIALEHWINHDGTITSGDDVLAALKALYARDYEDDRTADLFFGSNPNDPGKPGAAQTPSADRD